MIHAARALGLGVMLGCMVESGLGVAAGTQIASLCDHVDLDGNMLIAEDPWPGVELVDGVQVPCDGRGEGGARGGGLFARRTGLRNALPDPRRGAERRSAPRQDARGVMRYAPEKVACLLDSGRVGESSRGFRSSAPSTTRWPTGPTPRSSAWPRRAAVFRLPGRSSCARPSSAGSTSRTACTSSSRTIRSSSSSRSSTGCGAARPSAAAAGPQRADR